MLPVMNNEPRRLYRHVLSGHSHRAQLFLSLLGLPCELVDVDLARRAHKTPAFLHKNPFGQLPVLEDGELVIADSNAILVYLAIRYDAEHRWYPSDAVAAAQVQRWLSVAAGPLADGSAAARRAHVFGAQLDTGHAQSAAHALLAVLDGELKQRPCLVGSGLTIADIALYTYTAHAPEGGVSLAAYEHVRAWLARIEALPRFVGMQRTAPSP
jgi:glutathione S-transferase